MEMYKIYDGWHEIAQESYETKYDTVDFNDIDHIVFTGMGGSGAIGDIFASILSKTDVHLSIVKGYHFPNTADKNTLVIATSISGNTVETLSVLDTATKSNCKIIAFSSGGKMEEFCTKNNVNYRKIAQVHSSRSSFPIFLYSMLKVLGPVIPINKNDILESLQRLEKVRKQISSSNISSSNPSLNLAQWISGIPVIYYPWGLQAAAIRFKNSIQENAKMHAIAEDVMEASHNGIVAWEKKTNVKPILIEGSDDYIKTKERWKIFKEFFQVNQIEYREVLSGEGSILTKLISLIYTLDYTTIYLSALLGIDPTPVKSINFIKNSLDALPR